MELSHICKEVEEKGVVGVCKECVRIMCLGKSESKCMSW